MTAADLEQLHASPDATAAAVSGLDQATFEHFVAEHGHRYSQIQLWKCPRITDLTPLEDLPGLEVLDVYWNQRCTRLWDLSRTPLLRALRLRDFRRLHDVSELADGTALTETPGRRRRRRQHLRHLGPLDRSGRSAAALAGPQGHR